MGSARGRLGRREGGAAGLVAVLALVVTACGGGSSDPAQEEANGETTDALCAPELLEEAVADDGPVEVTFWHGYTEVTDDTLNQLVEEFNDSQEEVRVSVVNQAGEDLLTKLVAGRTTGDLPDVFIVQEVELQRTLDTELTLPMASCVEAHDYDMTDFLPLTVSYYTVEGTLQAMPYNVAGPLLMYNRTVLEDAGLDPDDPPETLDELHDYALQIAESDISGIEAGLGFERDGWLFEQFVALGGDTYVDNANGRGGRATEVTFDGEAGQEVFTVLEEMMADGSMSTSQRGGLPDHLLGLGEGSWGMTMTSSSALGPAYEVMAAGQYAGTDFDVAPMPVGDAEGGVVVGGGALHVTSPVETDDPAAAAAAWRFVEYLVDVENDAYFAAETGYVPVRISAAEEPALLDRWEEAPYFRVAYDQFVEGVDNDATAGAVVGEAESIRDLVMDAWRRMADSGLGADDALADVTDEANDLIADYNDRIGE